MWVGEAFYPKNPEQQQHVPARECPPSANCSSVPCRKDIAKVTIFYQQLNYQAVNESPLLSVGSTTPNPVPCLSFGLLGWLEGGV